MFKKNNVVYLFLFLSIFIYFSFGSYRLEKFITTDEHYWINERIIQYWQAVQNQDWGKTYINDKPGISLAYISGLGLFWEKHPDLYLKKLEKHISIYDPRDTARLNLIFRLPLLIFNGLFVILLFWLTRKVIENSWIALFTSIFIALSPILLGISRIVNPDALLWNLSFAGILSFMAYQKSRQKRFALLTTIFLGFLLLTKYTSVILFPFLFLLIILFFLFRENPTDIDSKEFIKSLLSYALICAGAFAILLILMPSALAGKNYFKIDSVTVVYSQLWKIFYFISAFILIAIADKFFLKTLLFTNLFKYLAKTRRALEIAVYVLLFLTVIFIIANWLTKQGILNLDGVPFDAKRENEFTSLPYYKKFILELYPIVFSLSPVVLMSLLYLWIKSIFTPIKNSYVVFSLSSFIIIYFVATLSTDLLSTIRYSIMIYPIIMFLAAIGLWNFYETYKNKCVRLPHIIIILIASGIFSLWQIKPFYFNYTNALLPEQYLITGSWGEGGYEAAQYLNSLPDAKNLTVWADYSGVCEFFNGTCIKVYRMEKTQFDIDYYVLTRRGEINYRPSRPRWRKSGLNYVDAYKYYEKDNPIWELNIGNRPSNFIKIFKAE